MTVIFWTDQKWYEIYVNGQYVCEILAINKPHAVMKANHDRTVKASREGRTNECYLIYAREKGESPKGVEMSKIEALASGGAVKVCFVGEVLQIRVNG